MTDREKVIRALEHCINNPCNSLCPAFTQERNTGKLTMGSCMLNLMSDALALLMEQCWIPATNPPKETGRYLVTILEAGEYMSAEAAFIESSEVWRDPVEEHEHYNHVVAWMPLPEPYRPKEEDNAE